MKTEEKKGTILNTIKNICLCLLIISTISYLIFMVITGKDNINYLSLLINSIWLVFVSLMISLLIWIKKKNIRNIIGIILTVLFMSGLAFNALNVSGKINLASTDHLLADFTNKSITDALTYASANKIEVEQAYEYSDNIDEYYIINQNIPANTKLEDIKKISFTVSLGPNYDKEVILPNMIGMNIDEAIKIINDNYLNNVTIEYVIDNMTPKDIITEQNIKGQIKRNQALNLTVSLGTEDALQPIAMIDLKKKDIFEATLWLKRNGLKYELEYQFSESIPRNKVINQNPNPEVMVNHNDTTVKLTISKGKEITVPDLKTMSIEEVITWIMNNDLKISFEDKYDNTKPIGSIISASVNTGDKIEVGTEVKIVTSKGPLKMGTFTSLNEFRNWAAKYGVEYKEEYEFNSKVEKGKIIRFSVEEGALLGSDASITVYVSNGTAVTVPNFVGKTKSQITDTCGDVGLNCSFQYGSYSSSSKDTATAQNKKANSTVVRGTYVLITLSKGTASTYTIEISESLLSFGNADATISSVRSYFSSHYPGVTFTFIKKDSNVYDNAGFIHESSPIKEGTKVTQGRSYEVWITK